MNQLYCKSGIAFHFIQFVIKILCVFECKGWCKQQIPSSWSPIAIAVVVVIAAAISNNSRQKNMHTLFMLSRSHSLHVLDIYSRSYRFMHKIVARQWFPSLSLSPCPSLCVFFFGLPLTLFLNNYANV